MTDTNIDDIGLIIDYDQPTARLFTDLAKGILQCAAAGGLAILSVPHGTSELAASMPSWVPDWSDSAGGASPLVYSISRFGQGHFCASGERNDLSTQCGFTGTQLSLQGYVVDRIEHVTAEALIDFEPLLSSLSLSSEDGAKIRPDGHEREDKFYKALKKSWIDFLLEPPAFRPPLPPRANSDVSEPCPPPTLAGSPAPSLAPAYQPSWATLDMRSMLYPPTSEVLGVAYVRTLCADSFPPLFQLDGTTYIHLINALDFCLTAGDINPHGMWNVVQRLMLLDADSSNKSQDSPPIEFPLSKPAADDFSGTMDMMLGRRLMWSRDGYFGAVPAEAKKGDAIMLIQGCPVPLVVREVAGDVLGEGEESGQKWQLIGDCFVHGAMYGERWKTELCGKVLFV